MFIKVTRNGSRTYLQIAESYRDPETGKPRQRHIANLGRLDKLLAGGTLNTLIAGLVETTGQSELANWSKVLANEGAVFEPARHYGSAWAVYSLWKQLKLDRFFKRSLKNIENSSDPLFEQCLLAMVTNRLRRNRCSGGFPEWLARIYWPKVGELKFDQQRMTFVLDTLLRMKSNLERHITINYPQRDQAATILYGVIPLHIHDRAGFTEPLSDKMRNTAGIALTADGLPIFHEVNESTINFSATLRGLTARVRARFSGHRLVFLANLPTPLPETMEVLNELNKGGKQRIEYVVAVPKDYFDELMASNNEVSRPQWEATSRAQDGELVESVTLGDGRRVLVLRHPARVRHARRNRAWRLNPVIKFAGMLEKQLEVQEANQFTLGIRLTDAAAKVALSKAVAEAHASRFIHIDYDEPTFTWWWDVGALKEELALDGTLILLTNVSDLAAPEIVNLFNKLTAVEHGLDIHSSQLDIAPLDRRRFTRLQEHTLISYLALVMRQLLKIRLSRRSIDILPDQAIERIDSIQCHTVRVANNRSFQALSEIPLSVKMLLEAIDVGLPTNDSLAKR